MNSAFFSLSAVHGIKQGDINAYSHLIKGAALLYPNIVWFANYKLIDNIADQLSEGLNAKRRKSTRKMFRSIEDVDSRWAEGRDTVDLLDDLKSWLTDDANSGNIIEAGELIGNWIFEDKQSVTHPALALCICTQLDLPYYESRELAAPLLRLLQDNASSVSTDQQLTVLLPNLEEMSWDEVLELRGSPYIQAFRSFVHHHVPPAPSAIDVQKQVSDALWAVVGLDKPTASGSAVTRGCSIIPLPFWIPNPIGVAREIKDGLKERKLFVNYGWLYFLQEAQAKKEGDRSN